MSSLQPPPSSKIYERNSVHGYSTTSETEYSRSNLYKRRRKDDDLLDAFLEISDIMTWNQMQPITHAHIQNSPYETSSNNNLVLPHQQHIDNSDEIDTVDNVHDVYNVDNSDNDVGDTEEKKKKKRRGQKRNRHQQQNRQKHRNKTLHES